MTIKKKKWKRMQKTKNKITIQKKERKHRKMRNGRNNRNVSAAN